MASTVVAASLKFEAGSQGRFGTAPNSLVSSPVPVSFSRQYGNGTTAGSSIDRVYNGSVSIAGNGNTTLDLRSLTDVDASTITFAYVDELYVKNTGSASIRVSGGASNGWTGIFAVPATEGVVIKTGSSAWFHPNGASTSSSDKNLYIENLAGASTATAEIMIWGRSA